MTFYRKKPIEVRAAKYTGDPLVPGNEVHDLLQESGGQWGVTLVHDLLVTTVDGNEVRVPVGAYVVIDGKGFPYPCDAEIFEASHEPVEA